MKKFILAIAILLAVLLTTPLVGTALASEAAPDDYVISRKRTQAEEGLTVTMPARASVTMTTDSALESKGYVAVKLRSTRVMQTASR